MRSVLTFLFIFIGISPLSAAPVPAVNTSNVRHPNLAAGTTVRITEPIYLRDVRDYILDGQNTLIEYAGPAGVPAIIELGSCLNCTVKNFRIVDLSGADAAVLIGNLPAARVTDRAVCVGPPDVIVKGSATVLICKLPAARVLDMTAHGGTIVMGMPTVLIGG